MTSDDEEDAVVLWNREESPQLVIVKDPTETSVNCNENLTLHQYPSSHSSWGINSQVWDGGLATLSYLLYSQHSFVRQWRNTLDDDPFILLDLGSGTGVVGVGAYVWLVPDGNMNVDTRPHVIVTDIPDALPLLTENCYLNQSNHHGYCEAMELEWKEDTESPHIYRFLETIPQKFPDIHRLLIVGSDVIYRPYLFRPLLCSIHQMFNYFSSSKAVHRMDVRCIIGAQSIRTHLNQFYDIAQGPEFGFKLRFLATMNTESLCATANTRNEVAYDTNISYTVYLPTSKNMNEMNASTTLVGKGIVHILELSL